MGSKTAFDAFWNEEAPRADGTTGQRTQREEIDKATAVIKKWEYVQGRFGPQILVEFYFPGSEGGKYWPTETAYLNVPDPQDENEKRAVAQKLALKDICRALKLSVHGLADLEDPAPSPVGCTVKVSKKMKGKYTNWTVDELISRPAPSSAAKDNDPVPF